MQLFTDIESATNNLDKAKQHCQGLLRVEPEYQFFGKPIRGYKIAIYSDNGSFRGYY